MAKTFPQTAPSESSCQPAVRSLTAPVILYLLVPLVSAVLLFQSELLLAKYILPWFGGTPNVWSVSMLFFQVVLIGGYAYSHWMITRLSPRLQAAVHLAVLGASSVLLAGQLWAWGRPLLPSDWWKPAGPELPSLRILALLTVSIGLPFFTLSATSSLLQGWFSRQFPGRSPYKLFALSNAGSLLGLVSYPFVVEPAVGLRLQAAGWSVLFIGFAAGCGYLAVQAARRAPGSRPLSLDGRGQDEGVFLVGVARKKAGGLAESPSPRPLRAGPLPSRERSLRPEPESPPSWRRRLLWLALATGPSVLLLATTNQIADQVAVIPFLWAIPLAIYLLTFVLAFSHRVFYGRFLFLLLGLSLIYFLGQQTYRPLAIGSALLVSMGFYYAALFVFGMLCHGELARLRPSPRHLTGYYLCISIGGALGGVLVALVAPRVFDGLWELYIGYFLCGLAVYAAILADAGSFLNTPRLTWLVRMVSTVPLVLLAAGPVVLLANRLSPSLQPFVRPVGQWLGLQYSEDQGATTILARRNFYGILRVIDQRSEMSRRWVLRHGQTTHGWQFVGEGQQRHEATTYYTERSGVGRAILGHPKRAEGRCEPMRVGLIGMGTGTLAVYGRPGDTYVFYEIDQDVIALAGKQGSHFTFLRDSEANVEIVPGDARISLERQEPRDFDILVLDAFSGDSIPVHLLTKEAFGEYLRNIRPDGIIACHISNMFLDLRPLVWKLAETAGLQVRWVQSMQQDERSSPSVWILLFRDKAMLREAGYASLPADKLPDTEDRNVRVWTDDYSDVYHLLRPPTRLNATDQAVKDHWRRGMAYYERHNLTTAISEYTAALRIKPDVWAIYADRAIAYEESGQFDEAFADYAKVLNVSPNSSLYHRRGMLLARLGRTSEAIQDFDRAIAIEPTTAGMYLFRGQAKMKLQRWQEAVKDFDSALRLDPRMVAALNFRGLALGSLEKPEEALADFARALQIQPDSYQTYSNRARFCARVGRYQQAIDDLTLLLSWNNRDARCYQERARCYLQLKDFVRADQDVRHAQELGLKVDPKMLSDIAGGLQGAARQATSPASP